jgi:hypothetical protein
MKHAVRGSVVAVSPELNQGIIGGYTISEPTLVLLTTNMDEHLADNPNASPIFNRFVTKYTYNNDQTHYSVTRQLMSNNPNFVAYPENIVQPTK